MKKQAFKIGDTVYFMDGSKPTSKEVKSIVTVEGEVKLSYKEIKTEVGETKTVYLLGTFDYIEEQDVFATIEELRDYVFNLS